jgi:hypothetical protein
MAAFCAITSSPPSASRRARGRLRSHPSRDLYSRGSDDGRRDPVAGKWTRQIVDPGSVAIEDLSVGDLNGDGRLDILNAFGQDDRVFLERVALLISPACSGAASTRIPR